MFYKNSPKMKKILFIVYFLFITTYLRSQIFQDDCGTSNLNEINISKLIWYGNNAFLYDFFKDFEKNQEFQFLNKKKIYYKIPLKFWVYCHKNDKKRSENEKIIKKIVSDINFHNLENETGLIFFLYEIEYIKKKRFIKLNYFTEYTKITKKYKDEKVINIHLVGSIKKFGDYVKGSYNKFTKGIILTKKTPSTTLTHEIGHYFGLLHTHRNWRMGKCLQEAVDRNKKYPFYCFFKDGKTCESSGDGLCDTPAEPVLQKFVNEKCEFIGENLKDNWGDFYKPSVNNIMSYVNPRTCRDNFTKEQIAVILYNAKNNKNENLWKIQKNKNIYDLDNFEPDNTKFMASEIKKNEKNYHTFHKKFNKDKIQDIDWVKFLLKYKKNNIEIEISKEKSDNINLHLSLYDSNHKEIMTFIETKNEGNLKIPLKNLDKGFYFLKIESNTKIEKTKGYFLNIK